MWLWEGTDAMYMFKNWEEDYLECYRSLMSVWSGSGTWEGGGGKPNLIDCVLKMLFSIDLSKGYSVKDT